MRALLMGVFLLVAVPAHADEPTLILPDAYRPGARLVSDGLVYGTIAWDAVHSLRADDRKGAFISQGCRMGVAIGSTLLLKNLVHRDRPDHSNYYSFPSGHSANSMAASRGTGWGLALSFGVGSLRELSGRHHWSDVAAGWGLGLLAMKVCP